MIALKVFLWMLAGVFGASILLILTVIVNEAISFGTSKRIQRVPEERPWGEFETFAQNQCCTVKLLTVYPGQALSLQRHKMRDQLYYIIDPLVITNGTERHSAKRGDVFYFPRGTVHRAENKGKYPAEYMEVAWGKYAESDIERLEDKYGRTDE